MHLHNVSFIYWAANGNTFAWLLSGTVEKKSQKVYWFWFSAFTCKWEVLKQLSVLLVCLCIHISLNFLKCFIHGFQLIAGILLLILILQTRWYCYLCRGAEIGGNIKSFHNPWQVNKRSQVWRRKRDQIQPKSLHL